ncbi:MAG: endonuclease III [Epsilonproteobacteria bacterium]|nr:endonuclease III [Campylobacterota bacterium]
MLIRTPKEVKEIKKRFLTHYPNAKTELNYSDLYQLLVAVILSAQCTDKRVNLITPKLFQKYPTIFDLAKAEVKDVEELIKSCTYFSNKAKHLVNMAKMVVEEYKGEIPKDEKELVKLPGVGKKSANVVMIEYFGKNLMAVDTHVFRVSHRLGLSSAKTPDKTQQELTTLFKTDLNKLHHAMVLFGRYICTAKEPKCKNCFLKEFCVKERDT